MKSMSKPSEEPSDSLNPTQVAILDAAEGLFAEEGIEKASLRAITARAGVNLAAVHYHFHSKEGLIRAVFRRRIEPVNQERLALLDRLEASGAPAVEAILHAFIAPVIRRAPRSGGDEGGSMVTFRRLMGRMYSAAADHARDLLHEHFVEVAERFPAALARALPHLPRKEILWRFHFLLGSMIQVTLNSELIVQHSRGACDPADSEALIERLVAYGTAGFRAPMGLGSLGGESESPRMEEPPREDAPPGRLAGRPASPARGELPEDWAVWET